MERTARIRVRARKSIKLEFNISEIIDQVYWPPCPPRGSKQEEPDRKLPENFKYHENWGYTICRTYYGPHSDQYWNILLGALKQQTLLALGYYEDQDDDQEDLERVKKLFHLDAREDASLLEGLDVRGIREVCMKEDPCDRTMAAHRYRHVLLADESVLNDIANGESIVKAVAFEWEEGDENWGWMRIPTGYLLELYHLLWFWDDHRFRALRYDGSEEEGLERYIWSGEDSAPPTSQCSEVRPLFEHYEAQRPIFGVHRPSILKRKQRD
ncbi:hypothetical protein EDB80DRAFT_816704 [Ilyonectria destructans]|nr:hypothetical protein EDB80DRAFT_816704 [Ilyonectria destructans]